MFRIAFQRFLHPRRRPASAGVARHTLDAQQARSRVEVCPPATRRPAPSLGFDSWREHLGHWIDAVWPSLSAATRHADLSKPVAGAAPLAGVRHEFARSLDDIPTERACATLNRIRLAGSLHELWHLRPDVFHLVSHQHDQAEADRRLGLLNRHFPTRAPRSGFGTLTSSATRDTESRAAVPGLPMQRPTKGHAVASSRPREGRSPYSASGVSS